jgi:hypothetical protein
MSIDFPCLLGAIVIDSDNNTLILDEAGVDITCTIASGTYYLTGDGTASDILLAVKTALDGSASANTYTLDCSDGVDDTWSRDTADTAVTVRVTRASGGANFRVRWPNASTTFPSAALGFIAEKGAANSSAESGTRSPTHVWVGAGHIEDAPPRVSWDVRETPLGNGDTDIIRTGDKRSMRSIALPLQPSARLFVEDAGANLTESTLENFLDVCLDGRPVRFYRLTLAGTSSAVLLDNPSAALLDGTYRLGEGAATCLESPARSGTGLAMFDISIPLVGYIAP